MATKQCNYCDATTNKSLSDFWEIGWEAVSFSGKKAVCACPKHTEQLQNSMKRKLRGEKMEKIIETTDVNGNKVKVNIYNPELMKALKENSTEV